LEALIIQFPSSKSPRDKRPPEGIRRGWLLEREPTEEEG